MGGKDGRDTQTRGFGSDLKKEGCLDRFDDGRRDWSYSRCDVFLDHT